MAPIECEIRAHEWRRDGREEPVCDEELRDSPHYLFKAVGPVASCTALARLQVREDRQFYVPDLLSDENYELDAAAYSAADAHARHLRKAEGLLNDAQNLSKVLRASLDDVCDSRAMQAETVLKIIEKKLSKAYRAIDRHGRRHSNLFLAYFERRGGSARNGPN
jgi:hypothetical protein